MRTIIDIYNHYKVMPNVQLHQLRVAAVAEQVCESLDVEVNKEAIVLTCLLHDLGKIVVSKLDYFPEFLKPEGHDYWHAVQNECISQYGNHEHSATVNMIKELNVEPIVLELMDAIDFLKSEEHKNDPDLSKKICYYVDMRVSPHGVVALEERILDANKRYQYEADTLEHRARIASEQNLRQIEKHIFSHSNLKPSDINDESIKNRLEKLRNTNIS